MAGSNIPDMAGRKTRRRRTQAIAKCYGFHANTITMLLLKNLSIYEMQKNIRQQCKNSKLKIIVPMWNDEFELPGGFYSISDGQDYMKYIMKT